jgi:hypothetical protein
MAAGNVYQIVVSASDQASKAIAPITKEVGAIATSARNAIPAIAGLTKKFAELTSSAVVGLFTRQLPGGLTTTVELFQSLANRISQTKKGLKGLAEQAVVANLLQESFTKVRLELERVNSKFTDFASSIGTVSSGFALGFIPQLEEVQQEASVFAERVSASFGGIGGSIRPVIATTLNAVDGMLLNIFDKLETVPRQISEQFTAIAGILNKIQPFEVPQKLFQATRNVFGSLTSSVFRVTQEIGTFSLGLQALQGFVSTGPFQLLIQQNARLRSELLSTQASLVATNRIMQQGKEINDPTQAIQALEGPISDAIAQLRQDSLELVGVTSAELVPIYQQIAQNSSNIGASLLDSKDLTLSFSAALGTLGIPLFQARQEIGSILTGTIDMNSVLAKSLGITNEQVGTWRSQGRLVEELLKKLESFRAGNALAAASLSGVTSNIQEVFEEITRIAGEPLLDFLVQELNEFYEYINNNREVFAQAFEGIVQALLRTGQAASRVIRTVVGETGDLLAVVPTYLVNTVANFAEAIANAVETVLPAMRPLLDVFAALLEDFTGFADSSGGKTMVNLIIGFQTASIAVSGFSKIFSEFAVTMPVVGDIIDYVSARNNGMINTFLNLRNELGTGTSALLLLGKNLGAIPGGFQKAAQSIPVFGAVLAPLIPQLSNIAIQGVGLLKVYPQLGGVLANLSGRIPTLTSKLAPLAESILPGLGDQLTSLGGQASKFGQAFGNATSEDRVALIERMTGATGKLNEVAKQLGKTAATAALKTALITAGIFVAIQAFDQFVLKNENLMETLGAIGDLASKVGGAITGFLSNPFVMAATGAIALVSAIRSGILPAFLDMAKAFATSTFNQVTQQVTELTGGMQQFSKSLRKITPDSILAVFGNRGALQRQSQALLDEFESGSQAFVDAVQKRQDEIKELDAALKNDTFSGDDSFTKEIQERRDVLEQEIKQLTDLRQKQANELTQIQQRASEATPIGTNVNGAIQTSFKETKNALSGVKAEVSDLAGNAMTSLGDRVKNLGFDKFGNSLQTAGNRMTSYAGKVTIANAAQGNFSQTTLLTSTSLRTMGGRLASAGSKLLQFASTLVTTLGPIVAIGAATAIISENVGIFSRLTRDSSKAISEYSTEIENLRNQLDLLSEQSAGIITEEETDIAKERLQSIEEEQTIISKSINSKWLRALLPITLLADGLAKVVAAARGQAGETSEAQARLNKEILDQAAILEEVGNRYDEYNAQIEQAIADETELAEILNQQAELRANGDNEQADRLQTEIDLIQKRIDARKEVIDEEIAALEALEASSDGIQASQRINLQLLTQLRDRFNEIKDTEIIPPELPRLGALFEQLPSQAENAFAKIQEMASESGGGQAADFQEQSKIVLDLTQQQLELGQITQAQAAERFRFIASNTSGEVELQRSAQEALTKLYQDEGQRQVAIVEGQQSAIQLAIESGQMSAREGEVAIARLQQEQIAIQLQQLEESAAERRNIREQQRKEALEEAENEIERLRAARDQGEEGAEQDLQDALARRQSIIETANQEALQDEERTNSERLKLQAEAAKARNEALIKELEAEQRKVLSVVERAERQRNIDILRLRRQGLISEQEAESERLEIRQDAINAELATEQAKLEQLLENEDINQEAVKETRERIQELISESLENEQRLIEAHIAAIEQALNDQAQAYANSLQEQNQQLQTQLLLYDSLETALENRNRLLDAANDLNDATSNFITGQLDALSSLETSEHRRREIARATAAIKLEALLEEQRISNELFELEQERERLAIQRRAAQNEQEINRLQQEVALGQNRAQIAEAQYREGLITQAERDQVILDQQEKVLRWQPL